MTETVLLTGASGCLGTYLLRNAPANVNVVATQFQKPVRHTHTVQVDLRDPLSVSSLFDRVRPDLVIHTAYDASDPKAGVIESTQHLVDGAVRVGAQFIHLSSDMVLSGQDAPYDESAPSAPIIDYGRAKATVEEYVMARLGTAAVIRTSLIVGLDPVNPSSLWIIDSLRNQQQVYLFTDEFRCPILAEDLAKMIWEISSLEDTRQSSVWNIVGPEALSRYDIGLVLASRFKLDASLIVPRNSSEADAPRPRDLRLTSERADKALKTRPRPISTILLDD